MQKKFLTIFLIALIGMGLLFWVTYENPSEKANALYVNACQLIPKIRASQSYTEAYSNYKEAKVCLEKITSLYPGTEVAVKLTANQMKLGNINLTEFQKIEKELDELANAEQEPLDCAAYCAIELKCLESIIDISESYFLQKNKKKAENLLNKVIEGTEVNNSKEFYLSIIKKLIEIGANDRAIGLLNRISRESQTVKKQELADYYAKAGKVKMAMETMENEEPQWTVGFTATVLRKIYETKAAAEDKELKKIVFEKITESARRSFYVVELVKLLAEIGEKKKANETAELAIDSLKDFKASEELEVRETLAELRQIPKIGKEVIESNVVLKAEQQAYQLLKQIETPTVFYGEEILIIKDFRPYMPEGKLITAMTKIIENLNLLEYEPTKAKILINVGTIFYKLGNKEAAQTFFNQARKIVIENRDENDLGFTEAYDGRFVAQLALEQKDKALFEELLEAFQELAPSQWKNGFKAQLAAKLFEFGQEEKARKIHHETIDSLGTNYFYEGIAESWCQVLKQQPKINGKSGKEAIKNKILQALEKTMNKLNLEDGETSEFCFNLTAIARAHVLSKVELENKDDEILKKIVNILRPLDKTLGKWLN